MAVLLIYLLTTAIRHGQAFFFNAMSREGDVLEGRIFGKKEEEMEMLAEKICKGRFVLIQKYSLSTSESSSFLKLTGGISKIFQTGSHFDLDEEKINQFYHAPICTVPEATSSPKKRRISIQGTVAQVFDIKQGATWSRRDVYLEDGPTAKRICVKLWDNHASKLDKSHQAQKVTIENVEVDIFQEKRQLKSTDLTNVIIEDVDVDNTFKGEQTIMGIDRYGDSYSIMLEDEREFFLEDDLLESLGLTFDDFRTKTPVRATITVENGKLVALVLPSTV